MGMGNNNYKLLGVNDDKDTCCQCGRSELKRVVWLEPVDSDGNAIGEPIHLGTTCAAYAMMGNRRSSSVRQVERLIDEVEFARKADRDNRLRRVAADKQTANRHYASTRRPLDGSYFAFNGESVVRVDGTDSADVSFFNAEGFAR
jgi:hypothetical protein